MEQVKIDTFDLFIANVHLVRTQGKKVLIDICEAKRVEQVEAALVRIGLSPNDIDLIVCTHGHADHCGGARHFQERYQISVALGKGDLEMVRRGKNGPILPYTLTDWLVRRFIAYNDELPPFTPDIVIERREDLTARGFTGEAIPLPCTRQVPLQSLSEALSLWGISSAGPCSSATARRGTFSSPNGKASGSRCAACWMRVT